jgi:drug/metabolite transporter (DMT)-like permease
MASTPSSRAAYGYAGLTVLLWSTVATAFKLGLAEVGVLPLLFHASLVSTLALLVAVALQGKLRLLAAYGWRGSLRSAALGLLNPTLYYLVLLHAYQRLPAQEAQPLNFVWPLVLAVLAVPALGQRLAARTLLGLAVSFAGVVVIATRGQVLALRFTDPLGVALAVGSSLVWAVYWLLNVRDPRDDQVKLLLGFGLSLVPLGLLAWRCPGLVVSWRGWLAAAYIGLFEMGVTFVLWLRALSLAPSAAQVTRLVYLVPFGSLVCIALVLHEPIRAATLVGLGLIVGGIVLGARR